MVVKAGLYRNFAGQAYYPLLTSSYPAYFRRKAGGDVMKDQGCFFVFSIRFASLLYVVCLVLVFLGFALQLSPLLRVAAPGPAGVSGRTIVIDAGHGGRDPGAIGRTGLQEKEINLDIAKRLKRFFSRVGVYVVMTREADIDYGGVAEGKPAPGELTQKRRDILHRIRVVNQSKADLLLSIHVNSFPQSIWSGAQCFYDLRHPASKAVAECIQEQLVEKLGPNRRKALAADYMLLKSTDLPSVTVEVGFISNPREEQLLATAEYRERLAEAIFLGTIIYLAGEEGEKRAAPVSNLVGKVYPEIPPPPVAPGFARLFFTSPYSEDLDLYFEERDLGFTPKDSVLMKAERLLDELQRGPGESSALLPCLPPGDWVTKMSIRGNQAFIDLKPDLVTAVNGGVAAELLGLYSIVNTLAFNLELDQVTVLIDGQKGYSLGGHILLDEPVRPREDLIHQTK